MGEIACLQVETILPDCWETRDRIWPLEGLRGFVLDLGGAAATWERGLCMEERILDCYGGRVELVFLIDGCDFEGLCLASSLALFFIGSC